MSFGMDADFSWLIFLFNLWTMAKDVEAYPKVEWHPRGIHNNRHWKWIRLFSVVLIYTQYISLSITIKY